MFSEQFQPSQLGCEIDSQKWQPTNQLDKVYTSGHKWTELDKMDRGGGNKGAMWRWVLKLKLRQKEDTC